MLSKPEQNVAQLGLREGMRVADLGAGTGAYSIAAGARVGYTGHVYAVEVQKNLIKKLESEIKESNVLNVECIWGDIEKKGGTKIADNSMDAVIIANVLFLSEDKLGLIDEAYRILKSGGKALFIDWLSTDNNIGPLSKHVIDIDVAINLFTKRGFKLLEKITTSEHHYGIIFIHE
ncbi:MAG: methyltransferase domain-containing protein [Candidatus Paceibacterota bacterium]